MSCFAYMPGLYTLDYWHEKYKGQEGHKRFLLTKLIEVLSFKWGYWAQTIPEKPHMPIFLCLNDDNEVPDDPKVCVVIPCYVANGRDQSALDRLLDALMGQHVMADIIIVDDASQCVVRPRHGEYIIRQKRNQGPAAARNKGVVMALECGADIVAFTDMDCIPQSDWLSAICDQFANNRQAHIVSGNTVSFGSSWLDRYHNMNGTLNGRTFQGRMDKLLYGTTSNLAITAQVGREIQFDETFLLAAGEDIEFCFRLNNAGCNIHHAKKAIVQHDYFYRDSTTWHRWKRFIKQFRKYAKGEKQLLKSVPNYYEFYRYSNSIVAEMCYKHF